MTRHARRRVWGLATTTMLAVAFAAPLTPTGAGDAQAAPTSPSAFQPLAPCRLFDTRTDGVRLGDNAPVVIVAGGRCGIPQDATAVALSVTVTQTQAAGFAVVWPGDLGRPATSTVNYGVGETRANGAVIAIGGGGTLALSSSASADVVVDVHGAFLATDGGTTSGRFVPTPPMRLLDTRETTGRLPAGGSVTIPLPAGVPADATALAVTIATSDSTNAGYFTAYPAGAERPTSSSLNTDGRGQVRATGQLVPVSAGGFTVFSQTGEHLIVDVTGWFTGPSAAWSNEGLFVPTTPTRVVDTRTATTLFPGGTLQFDPQTVTGGPVAAVAANWTLTRTWRGGFLTVFPANTDRPLAATANADRRNQSVAQFGVAPTSQAGLAAYSSSGTQLVVDVTGWFTGEPLPTTATRSPNTPVADTDKRVVLMGDSTLAGVRWYTNSQRALRGSSFVLDAESCRRLVGSSCRGREGRRPPNAVTAIGGHGLVDVVVVMTGYNDWHTTFADAFDQTVASARAAGARQILWLTYRERSTYSNPSSGTSQAEGFAIQNQIIRDKIASGAFPDVVMLDWNTYSDDRTDWFTSDGVHFTIKGAYGAADYIARAVASLNGEPCPAPWTPGAAIEVRCSSPDAHVGEVDPLAVYAGDPADVHCYEVGDDRHVECRPDPKLAH